MRKSLSAILATLMSGPVFAGTPAIAQGGQEQGMGGAGQQMVAAEVGLAFPREMPGELRERMGMLMAGVPLDVNGMRELQRRMLGQMQERVRMVQLQVPGGQGGQIQLMPFDGTVKIMPAAPEMEKAAFLGITTTPTTAILQKQLKLARGTGLVVNYIEKGSPADAAALKLDDILEKLDDQILINGQQLAVLVRMKKPGDTVTLTVLREGQVVSVTAKLAEKELPVLGSGGDGDGGAAGQDGNNMMFQAGGPMRIFLQNGDNPVEWKATARMSATVNPDGSSTRSFSDDAHDVSMTTGTDGKTNLTVIDHAGKVLFDGPYNTDEEKGKLPAELAGVVKKLEAGTKVSVKGDGAGNGEEMMLTRSDDADVITLHVDGKGKMVTVKDVKSGQVIYDGPANTAEDLKGLPGEVQAKVKELMGKAEGK